MTLEKGKMTLEWKKMAFKKQKNDDLYKKEDDDL